MKKQTFENEVCIMPRTKRTDYLWFVTKTSTKEQRSKYDIGNIFINAAVCVKCKEYIRSINRHDYVECSCGAIAVDGGSWYAKRHGDDENRVDIIEGFEDK